MTNDTEQKELFINTDNFNTDFTPLTVEPNRIYDYSFETILEEYGPHDYNDDEWSIIRRIVHASADF